MKKNSNIKKIGYILGNKRMIKFYGIAMLMFLGAILDMLTTYLVLPLVYAITDVQKLFLDVRVNSLCNILSIDSGEELIALLAMFIAVLYVVRSVYMICLNKVKYEYMGKCKTFVSSKIFLCLANKPYIFFSETNTASMQRLCINDVSRMFNTVEAMLAIFLNSTILIMTSVILVVTDTVLTITAAVVIIILCICVNRPIGRKVQHLAEVHTYHYTSMLKWVQQFVGGLKSIISTNRQGYFVKQFTYHSKEYAENEGRYNYLSSVTGYITNAAVMGAVFGYIAIVAMTGQNLEELIPIFALFAIAAIKLLPCVSNVVGYINSMKYNEQGLEFVYEQIKEMNIEIGEISIDGLQQKCQCKDEINEETLKDGIVVYNVAFGYNKEQTLIFSNVHLKIPTNQSVAFIGTTGAGKTTLADIILGLYKPQEGHVLVDGHDIHEEQEWWARKIGYIPQTIYLCEDTIRANVAFGMEIDQIDDDRVWKCLRDTQMEEFVKSLPDQLDTITGENGVKLSGGQRQRIGIARALYQNPAFLVLDEATSALDQDTEKAIMDTINNFAGKKTILIIAHRLSTIKQCDIIYRVENGNVSIVDEVNER